MFRRRLELTWQGRGDREIVGRLLVRVESIRKTSTGPFGIGHSPSIAGWQPDPHTLHAEVIDGPDDLAGRRLMLRLPGHDARRLAVGQQAGLALVADRTVAVCIATVPAGAAAAQ